MDLEKDTLIFVKAYLLFQEEQKILIFLLVINPYELKIQKHNWFCGIYNERKFQILDVFSPWKSFHRLIEEYKFDVEEDENSEDVAALKEGENLWQDLFQKFSEKEFLLEISNIVKNNKDEKIASILIKDYITDIVLDNKLLDIDNIDLAVEVYSPLKQKKITETQETIKEQQEKSKDEAKTHYIDLLPVIDPIKGKVAEKLRVGDIIVVKSRVNNVEIDVPICRIVPTSSMDRISITVEVDEETRGNFIVAKNLKIKTPSSDVEEKVNNYLFVIYILGSIVLFLLIMLIIFIF